MLRINDGTVNCDVYFWKFQESSASSIFGCHFCDEGTDFSSSGKSIFTVLFDYNQEIFWSYSSSRIINEVMESGEQHELEVEKQKLFDTGNVVEIKLPYCFFASESLAVLTLNLDNSVLSLTSSIFLPVLKSMNLISVIFLDGKSTDEFFSNCPALESLVMICCDMKTFGVLNISSPKLKSLSLRGGGNGYLRWSKIKVSSRSLVSIKYKYYIARDYLVENTSSLVDACIKLQAEFGQNKVDIIEIVSAVPDLYDQLPAFDNLKRLELTTGYRNIHLMAVAHLLQPSPKLEYLQIKIDHWWHVYDDQERWEPNSLGLFCLVHLKIVKIKCFGGRDNELELELVKFLLGNAGNLNHMAIVANPELSEDLERQTKISQMLISFPRASSTTMVDFKILEHGVHYDRILSSDESWWPDLFPHKKRPLKVAEWAGIHMTGWNLLLCLIHYRLPFSVIREILWAFSSSRIINEVMEFGEQDELQVEKKRLSDMGNVGEGCDRISDLPESILHHILSFLPARYAVRTSILSRRWQHLWYYVSILDFDDDLLNDDGINEDLKCKYMDFVDKVLVLHSSLNLYRVRLPCGDCDASRVDTWIRAAINREVKELSLFISPTVEFTLPCCLFTCESLEVLTLHLDDSVLYLPTSIFLPGLKIVNLMSVIFLDGKSADEFFSNCPALESLVMMCCDIMTSGFLHISAPKLKSLSICGGHNGLIHSKIKVSTPSLVSIKYDCYTAQDYLVENTPNLIDACIKLQANFGQNTVNSVHGYLANKFHRQLFMVEVLKLSDSSIECLHVYDDQERWESNSLDLLCPLDHLKTVEIKCFEGRDNELELVKFFLKNAEVLKQITVVATPNLSEDLGKQMEISRMLITFPRASRTTLVDFKILERGVHYDQASVLSREGTWEPFLFTRRKRPLKLVEWARMRMRRPDDTVLAPQYEEDRLIFC
uniref:F-box domain-containing protein n=1 Tax=Nelumbo nucifera TaxID=4432 RepID=A0A822Z3A7_NELNU|nr:TPA_asm: hypothetical protein HUJ06_006628 [Nelumbo nucifera]